MIGARRAMGNMNGDGAFARLRDEIWNRCEGSFPGVILAASAGREEGRTSVVVGLAHALAEAVSNGAILAVDADVRAPRLHEEFGIGLSPGLSDVLAGREDLDSAIRGTDRENILVLPAGEGSASAYLAVGSGAMKGLVDAMRSRAAVVLVDSPALEGGPEVRALSAMADQVLLVVRADRTDGNAAKSARDQLTGLNGDRVLGVVLNDVRFD